MPEGSRPGLTIVSAELGQIRWMLLPWRQCQGGETGSGVFLTYEDAGIGEDTGRDGAVRHAAIPGFPIPLGKPLPMLSLARAQSRCLITAALY